MVYFMLVILCLVSVELIHFTGFLKDLNKLFIFTKKVAHVLFSKKISDHWKEKVVPTYSFKIMYLSLRMLSVILLLICIFFISGKHINGFNSLALSLYGIFISSACVICYLMVKKKIGNE